MFKATGFVAPTFCLRDVSTYDAATSVASFLADEMVGTCATVIIPFTILQVKLCAVFFAGIVRFTCTGQDFVTSVASCQLK